MEEKIKCLACLHEGTLAAKASEATDDQFTVTDPHSPLGNDKVTCPKCKHIQHKDAHKDKRHVTDASRLNGAAAAQEPAEPEPVKEAVPESVIVYLCKQLGINLAGPEETQAGYFASFADRRDGTAGQEAPSASEALAKLLHVPVEQLQGFHDNMVKDAKTAADADAVLTRLCDKNGILVTQVETGFKVRNTKTDQTATGTTKPSALAALLGVEEENLLTVLEELAKLVPGAGIDTYCEAHGIVMVFNDDSEGDDEVAASRPDPGAMWDASFNEKAVAAQGGDFESRAHGAGKTKEAALAALLECSEPALVKVFENNIPPRECKGLQ